jgi:hypothetical protein
MSEITASITKLLPIHGPLWDKHLALFTGGNAAGQTQIFLEVFL